MRRHHRSRHSLAQPLGYRRRFLERRAGQQNQELVATPPKQQILGTQQFARRGCHADQNAIAGGMSVLVVDHLGVIEVKTDKR